MESVKVLIAEDHVITRQGMRSLLEKEGDLTVIAEAGDGRKAVEMVIEAEPDVVVMDIAMPEVNGIEATRQIKALRPATAVLILSAYDDDEYVFGLLEAGAAGYLLKTANGDELVNAIRAVNRGEPVLDPIILRKVIDRFRFRERGTDVDKPAEQLSERELDVLKRAARGMSNKEIADELHLSKRTVEGHLRTIFNKLGVGSRTEAVLFGLRRGWFGLEDTA
jgi:NarL family two-component system response regulator LiaR